MNAKVLTQKQREALRYIRNQLVHEGHSPSFNDIRKALKFKYPRSVGLILETLKKHRYIDRKPDGALQILNDLEEKPFNARTVPVPLVGTVSCGLPILATENVEAMVPVSRSLARPGYRYFLLRAKGDSMTGAGIEDSDLLLVRQQPTAQNGDIVVALIDDEATVKEFHRTGNAIMLKPRNKKYQPIILTEDFQVQGVVVTTVKT